MRHKPSQLSDNRAPVAKDEDEDADFPIFGSAEPEPVVAEPAGSTASTNDPSRAASEAAQAIREPSQAAEEEGEEEEEEEEESDDVRICKCHNCDNMIL